MAFALSLYSRPQIVPVCIKALMEKIEGRISQAELEERMRGLESRQGKLFNHPHKTTPHPDPLPMRGEGKEQEGCKRRSHGGR